MSDDSTELDALFEEIAAQRKQPVVEPELAATPTEPAPAAHNQAPPVVGAAATSDVPMFDCLGGIVRQLHDALRELGYDRAIADVVTQVSDSQNRLEYIASLTEQAANKVLNAVDAAIPAQDEQLLAGRQIQARWQRMFAGELTIEEFKLLAHDSQDFMAKTVAGAEAEKARLMEIMMAQDFQDITGQIIKKVLILAQQLEQQLAQMLRSYAPSATVEKQVDLLAGPDNSASTLVQDGVDSILSELGF